MRRLMWMILSIWFYPGLSWADELKTIEVWKNLFTISKGMEINSNSTFLITKEGVVVVDTMVTPAEARKVRKAIRKQTKLPILYTINTNYHGDHTLGNQVFKESRSIIAHENVRRAMEYDGGKELLKTLKSLKIPRIEKILVTPPNIIFRDKMDIYAGEYHLELIHVKGSTDGDLFIYIEALKTLITGDLVLNKQIPYMGDAYIEDWIKAINYMGDLNAEIYIPGRGDPGGKPILIAMKHYLFELSRMVENQIKNGSSLKETQEAVRPKLKAKYSNWKKLEWLDENIERAYREFSLK